MDTVDIELEDQAEIEGDAGQRLRGRLPLRLTLRGDLSDIGNVLLALRALGGFGSHSSGAARDREDPVRARGAGSDFPAQG